MYLIFDIDEGTTLDSMVAAVDLPSPEMDKLREMLPAELMIMDAESCDVTFIQSQYAAEVYKSLAEVSPYELKEV